MTYKEFLDQGYADNELMRQNCELESEVKKLRMAIRHCEDCGGSWVDDGLSARCSCGLVKDLRAENRELSDLCQFREAENERLLAENEKLTEELEIYKAHEKQKREWVREYLETANDPFIKTTRKPYGEEHIGPYWKSRFKR